MAQNIFDFWQFNNMSRMQNPLPTAPKTRAPATLNFWAPMSWTTNFQTDIAPKVTVPWQQTTSSTPNFFTQNVKPQATPSLKIPWVEQANAQWPDIIQQYLDDENEDYDNRQQIFKMIENWEDTDFIKNSIVNTIWYKWQQPTQEQPWFIWWVKESITNRLSNIWEWILRPQERPETISKNPVIASLQPLWSAIWQVGQVAGAVWDVGFEVLKWLWRGVNYLSWWTIWQALEWWAKKLWNSLTPETQQTAVNAIQQWWEIYSQFKKENPYIADTLEWSANIASLLPIGKAWQVWVKAGEKVISKAWQTTWKVIKKVWQKIENIRPTRATEDISANILQPYKWMTENLSDANKWLQRVVQETWVQKWADFENLLKNTWTVKEKYWKILDEQLSALPWVQKSISANNALNQLKDIYKWTLSQESKKVWSRVDELLQKNIQEWLTAKELNEVKILHTKANNLFNEKWQATWWFSSDDLRNIRSELKNEVEDFAEVRWVTNIRDINKVYWELLDTEWLLKNQIANVKSFKWRQLPDTLTSKIAKVVTWMPVIKQIFTDPTRWILQWLWVSLRADKINPIEVQKRLPWLLKELQKAGLKEWDLKKIEVEVWNEIKRLALPPWKIQPKELKALPRWKYITPQTVEKWVILESKKWLSPNIKPNATPLWVPKKINETWREVLKPKEIKKESDTYMSKEIKKINSDFFQWKINKKEYEIKRAELRQDMKFISRWISPTKLKKAKENIISQVTTWVEKELLKPKTLKDKLQNSPTFQKLWDKIDEYAEKTGARKSLFWGEWAIKSPVSNLEKAKNWEKSWKNADDIWKETWWEKWTDWKWKFEIDDSKAKLKEWYWMQDLHNWEKIKLNEILEHDDLYKQYPNLKNLDVIYDSKEIGASFIPKKQEIIIWKEILYNYDKKLKSTLLHEIQHNIQEIENFAKGWTPRWISSIESKIDIQDKAKIELNKLTNSKEFKKLWDDFDTWKITYKQMSDNPLNKKYERLLEDSMIDENIVYKRLAWETEARNIQTRLLKTPQERKILRPAKTEDVARDKQIVKMEWWKAMSLPVKWEKVWITPKELEPLYEEARKYKSAEEFIKSQWEPVYHWSKGKYKDFTTFDKSKIWNSVGSDKEWIFFTNSKILADRYTFNPETWQKWNILESFVKFKNPLKINVEQVPLSYFTKNKDKIFKDVKKWKYDWVIIKSNKFDEDIIIALETNQIKTESQLKQIYEQAKKE